MFNGKIHYKWPFSIAMLVHQRVPYFFLGTSIVTAMSSGPFMDQWISLVTKLPRPRPKEQSLLVEGPGNQNAWEQHKSTTMWMPKKILLGDILGIWYKSSEMFFFFLIWWPTGQSHKGIYHGHKFFVMGDEHDEPMGLVVYLNFQWGCLEREYTFGHQICSHFECGKFKKILKKSMWLGDVGPNLRPI